MSIGLGRSYQHVGLNRLGAYLSVSKDKGPELADKSVGATDADRNVLASNADRNVCATTEKQNEIWRRITGIYPGVELKPKVRKRGLRNLARRLEERMERATSTAETQRRGERNEDELQRQGHGVTGRDARTTRGLAAEISFAGDFKIAHEDWARVQNCSMSIEAVCVELGCTRERLTMLLKEYCGLTAGEFFDALNFSAVRRVFAARMREAAQELWGCPGSFVAVKLMNGGLAQRREDAKNGTGEGVKGRRGEKRSKYFCSRLEDMFEETRGEERARRVNELCEQLRAGTGGQATSVTRHRGQATSGTWHRGQATGGTRGTRGARFELESWAISAGFDSGAKLRRACLNVCGRTLEQIERMLAAEVVQFYLCAEDRELRAIACSDRLSVEVARARELYHRDDAKPEAPFEDEWAKFEELKAEWLARMWKEFG